MAFLLRGQMAIVALLSVTIVLVSAHGVPSAEMFMATSLDEYKRLADLPGGQSIDQRKLRRANRQRKLQTSQPLLAASFGGVPGFYHGVASGDPLPDAVVVWTRYTPTTPTSIVTLELRMAAVDASIAVNDHLDPSKNPNLKRALIEVTSASDWVAKVDMTGLKARTNYVYAFSETITGTVSDVGQTKTAPALTDDVAQLQYAVFSCSNFPNGFFHAYDVASTIKDLDFWVHVGDYVYEGGTYGTVVPELAQRYASILPTWEMVSLQDYRLRHATYHSDEGLRNLRRRAPLIATWDDHETTNNSYGQGAVNNTGADNHQPVCSVNFTATNAQKQAARCDRDEGDAGVRFRHAAQAYMEWLPIRRGPGTMGVVNTTSITQIIEWGNLASVVAFDTRLSFRSKEPTLRESAWTSFPLAFNSSNVTAYREPPLNVTFAQNAATVKAELDNPKYTMIGKNIDILKNTFEASKTAGKPWQIWAAATMMATHIGPDLSRVHEMVPNATLAAIVRNYFNTVLQAPTGGVARALVAMAQTQTPFNSDDFNGFTVERAAILKIAKENANNAVILGGDLHDSWAWTLNEGGSITGTPVAINLGTPGTTSNGFGQGAYPLLAGLEPFIGGRDAVYGLINAGFKQQNPSLVFGDTQFKGFYAVKATKTTHTTEYFHIRAETILSNYSAARTASGRVTANFNCASSLVTTAGQKGSLVPQASCSAIQYDAARPATWNIPFPKSTDVTGVTRLTRCNMDACRFNVDTCTYNQVESFSAVNTSATPVQLLNLSNPTTGGPPIIDLTAYPNCKLNFAAFAKTEPAGCQVSANRCVNVQLGTTSRKETSGRFTVFGKDGAKYLDGTPKGGIQSLRACIYGDSTCSGTGIGCRQFTVDIRGMAVTEFSVINAASKAVIGTLTPGSSKVFCMPRRRRIQIQASTQKCATKVSMKVSPGRGRVPGSPDLTNTTKAPFQMYGNNGVDRFRFGRTYTVTASSNDDTATVSASFRFSRCIFQ